MGQTQRIGILGGSFNPIHNAHLRLAVEALERLQLDRLDLVPCSIPPHKKTQGLLPFALRASCVELALQLAPAGLALNTLEQKRHGPSYTVDTLQTYGQSEPDSKLHFLMGAVDLPTLPSWKQGLELPQWASLVVVPRETTDLEDVADFMERHWPEARQLDRLPSELTAASAIWEYPQGTQFIYLPLPRLDVSSTLVRQLWRQGRSLLGLAPDAVIAALERERETVGAIWGQEGDTASAGQDGQAPSDMRP